MAELKLYFLGAPLVELNGEAQHIGRQKSLALLIYLAVTQRSHYRDWLATLLWPDLPTGRTQLRIALSSLRKTLGKEWFISNAQEISLRDMVWVDCIQLAALANQAETLSANSRQKDALQSETLSLYRADFLQGFSLPDAPEFDQWQFIEQGKLRNIYEQVWQEYLNNLLRHRNFTAAETMVQDFIEIDSLNENARRHLMQIYLWTNRRQKAIREYQALATLLESKFGFKPESETQAIYQAILNQQDIALSEIPYLRQEKNTVNMYQLPVADPLIGRDTELKTILNLLKGGLRLLTFTGLSGIGKTHLALYLARQIEVEFEDGSFFIPIETELSVSLFTSILLDALGLGGISVEDNQTLLINTLTNKNVLIVIDDFDRVIDGVTLIEQILHLAPKVTLLLTSYDNLTLKNEYCFPVRGLNITANQAQSQAVELFIHRARHVQPQFELTPDNRDAVNKICQLVRGMPLGIILAAAWVDTLSPDEIVQEIEMNYEFLNVQHYGIPERHRNLTAVFDTTWRRQSDIERQILMSLSLCQGGFTQEAAFHIVGASLETIQMLVAKSLIYYDHTQRRYAIHDFLRQYALDQAHQIGDIYRIYQAYCRYYVNLLAQNEQVMKGHIQNSAWKTLNDDLENIQATWQYLLKTKQFDSILHMIEPFSLFLKAQGLWDKGFMLFAEARKHAESELSDSGRRVYLQTLSRLYTYDDAHINLPKAFKIAQQFQDTAEIAHIRAEQGWYWLEEGDNQKAQMCFEEAITYYTEHDVHYDAALAYRGLAYTAIVTNERDAAKRYMQKSLHLRRAIRDWVGEYETLILRADLFLLDGYITSAQEDYHEAFAFYAENFSQQVALFRCTALIWTYLFNRQYASAIEIAEQLLELVSPRVMSPQSATAIAVLALTHALQANRTKAIYYAENLDFLLSGDYLWSSKLNTDLLFLIYIVQAITHTLLDNTEQAYEVISYLMADERFTSLAHMRWMTPIVMQLLVENKQDVNVDDLFETFLTSEIASLAWIQDWTALQVQMDDLNVNLETQRKRQNNRERNTIMTAFSNLQALKTL